MSRRDEPHDWFEDELAGRGDEHEGGKTSGEGAFDDRLRDDPTDRSEDDRLEDVDRAIGSLKTPLPNMPDLTASILNAVDERREFLCDKTRWWVKAVRVAACVGLAGGALTAILAWRYAPETTNLGATPQTPMTLLLSATDAKACEGPAALRNSLNNVTAVEPTRLLTVVVAPMTPTPEMQAQAGQPAQVRFTLAPAEPLPCACRRRVQVSVQRTPFGSTWLQTVSVTMPEEAPVVTASAARSPTMTSRLVYTSPVPPGGLRMPKHGLISVNRPTLSVTSLAGEPNFFVWGGPADASPGAASTPPNVRTIALRANVASARAEDGTPLADGVGQLLGGAGAGGWISVGSGKATVVATQAEQSGRPAKKGAKGEPSTATDSGVRR